MGVKVNRQWLITAGIFTVIFMTVVSGPIAILAIGALLYSLSSKQSGSSRAAGIGLALFLAAFITVTGGLAIPVALIVSLGLITIAIVAQELQISTGLSAVDRFLYNLAYSLPKVFRSRDVHPAAREAMQRAGHPHGVKGLQLEDIGLLVYHGPGNPRIHRANDVPSDASHIRPFVWLNYSSGTDRREVVSFALLDDRWKAQHVARESVALRPGRNFVTPSTWLPMDDQQPGGSWTLEVWIGDALADSLLGIHEFQWLEVGGKLREQFNVEGELAERTRRLADLDTSGPVSVDELLEEQNSEVRENQMESGR